MQPLSSIALRHVRQLVIDDIQRRMKQASDHTEWPNLIAQNLIFQHDQTHHYAWDSFSEYLYTSCNLSYDERTLFFMDPYWEDIFRVVALGSLWPVSSSSYQPCMT